MADLYRTTYETRYPRSDLLPEEIAKDPEAVELLGRWSKKVTPLAHSKETGRAWRDHVEKMAERGRQEGMIEVRNIRSEQATWVPVDG